MKKTLQISLRSASCIALAAIALVSANAYSQERLIVIGGGDRPEAAMKRFIDWSGGPKANILVISWASGDPAASVKAFRESVEKFETTAIEASHLPPIDAEKRISMIAKIRRATGIFFTGGDQNRIMEVLLKEDEMLKILRERYRSGVPFAGTSAGAAVMSDPMMTGEADLKILDGAKVGVRPGLGLIPNIMFDQHFLVRQRHNRLFGFVLRNPAYLGVGIDEDTAVMIRDDRDLQVIGATQVMFINAKDRKGSMEVNFLASGQCFDLKKRRPAKCNDSKWK